MSMLVDLPVTTIKPQIGLMEYEDLRKVFSIFFFFYSFVEDKALKVNLLQK